MTQKITNVSQNRPHVIFITLIIARYDMRTMQQLRPILIRRANTQTAQHEYTAQPAQTIRPMQNMQSLTYGAPKITAQHVAQKTITGANTRPATVAINQVASNAIGRNIQTNAPQRVLASNQARIKPATQTKPKTNVITPAAAIGLNNNTKKTEKIAPIAKPVAKPVKKTVATPAPTAKRAPRPSQPRPMQPVRRTRPQPARPANPKQERRTPARIIAINNRLTPQQMLRLMQTRYQRAA